MDKQPLSTVKLVLAWILENLEPHTYREYAPNEESATWEAKGGKLKRRAYSWGDNRVHFLIPYCTFSDYSGSMVERANAAYMEEKFPHFITSLGGGYGTEWIGIDRREIPFITLDDFDALQDIVNGLGNYPSIDDDKLSEMEMEAYNEDWENNTAADFRKALVKQFRDDFAEDYLEETLDTIPNDSLRKFFEEAREEANTHWEIETGGQPYIRIERVMTKVTLQSLKDFLFNETQPKPDAKQLDILEGK